MFHIKWLAHCFFLLAIALFWPSLLMSHIEPNPCSTEKCVKLKAVKGEIIDLPLKAAILSKTLRNFIADLGGEEKVANSQEAIPLSSGTSDTGSLYII
jgi:hypothetical protein